MHNASIGVTPGPLDVEMQGDHATVRTTGVLTGGSGALLPERGRVHPVVSGLRREGGDWRMTSLAWGERESRAGMTSLAPDATDYRGRRFVRHFLRGILPSVVFGIPF